VTLSYPWPASRSARPSLVPAQAVGEAVAKRRSWRSTLASRFDPAAATGLALTVALLVVIVGGVLFGALAYLVRGNAHLLSIDNSVAKWGNRHAGATEKRVLTDVTQLASIYVVVTLCVVLAVVETIRERTRWVLVFIVVTVGGEEILTLTVKQLAHRIRPAFNPAAAHLGPSFPSGHSATAAVFYATAALLLGRSRGRPARALLAGLAVAIAVAVACTRVLLDVHWLSDVVAGLTLGWVWFAVCSVAFGGRLLRFGAAAEQVARAAHVTEEAPRGGSRGASSVAAGVRSPPARELRP
jgi:undecaprenyl-diphosphatase